MFARQGSIVQAFYFEKMKKALPITDGACVCKWSSSQNPLLLRDWFFLFFYFNFPYVLLLFISLMHFSYNESLLLLFIFLLKSCQKNVDWTEKMNCRDQNVSRRRM